MYPKYINVVPSLSENAVLSTKIFFSKIVSNLFIAPTISNQTKQFQKKPFRQWILREENWQKQKSTIGILYKNSKCSKILKILKIQRFGHKILIIPILP